MYPEGHGDDVTSIDRRVTYDMATCGSHPVMEHSSCRDWLAEVADDEGVELVMTQVGNYMYRSHESYGACGLGSDATDSWCVCVKSAGEPAGCLARRSRGADAAASCAC